jgi:hypothetical protein
MTQLEGCERDDKSHARHLPNNYKTKHYLLGLLQLIFTEFLLNRIPVLRDQITLFTLFNIYTLLTISNSFFEYIEEKDKMNENISNVHDG